jgi:hypothetical protein
MSIRVPFGVSQATASGLAARTLMYVSHHDTFLAHMDLRGSKRQEVWRSTKMLILIRYHHKSLRLSSLASQTQVLCGPMVFTLAASNTLPLRLKEEVCMEERYGRALRQPVESIIAVGEC